MDTVEDKIKKRSTLVKGLVSLTTPLTSLEFVKLSEEISPTDWRKLCFRLGVEEPALARAERENQYQLAECIYKTLARWRETQVESEERSVLLEALISCGLRRLEDRLCRGFPSRIGSVMTSVGPFCTALNVEQCRKELMTNYRTSLCMIQLVPWDPKSHVDMSSVFTNVCLVIDDTSSATKQQVSLPFNDIFKFTVNNAKPLRILIEGKAGSGKTTLMSKIAYDWMEEIPGSPLSDVPLVFCLQLRYLTQNDDFGEAVVELLLPEDTSITPQQIEEFAKANPDKVLIVLDGYDEFHPDIHGIKGVGNILRILENKRLTGCRVAVTCRPWKAADFKGQNLAKLYAHMTLEGFPSSSVETFIRRYFQKDAALADNLLSYLTENPTFQTVTQFPLFCSMLCQVWKDMDVGHRETMRDIVTLSRLFDHIFRYLWGHYKKKQQTGSKKGEKEPQEKTWTLTRNRRSTSAHETMDMSDCLKGLGRIALEGLISPEKKLQFTEEDFRKCPRVLRLACSLGILIRQRSRSTGDRTVIRLESKLNEGIIFFHKLAQEKCAGIYLSSMCTKHPKKFVRTLNNVYILTRADEFRYVLQFACGEDLYTAKKILRHMPNITPYQKLALECNFESQCGSKSNKRLTKFFCTPRLFMTGRPTAYSFSALEYYLKNSDILRPADKAVDFSYFATDGLCPPQLGKLVKVLSQPQFDFLIQFNMEFSRIDGSDVSAFIETLSDKKYLGVLEMSSSSANRQFVESLLGIADDGLDAMMMMYLPKLDARWARDVLLRLPLICPRLAALEATFTVSDVQNRTESNDSSEEVNKARESLLEDEVNSNVDIVPFAELATLCLKGCNLCQSGSLQLAKTLSHAPELEKLHLTKPSLHPIFYSTLSTLENLQEFSVKKFTFGQFHLNEFLAKCPILEDLYFETEENHNRDIDGVFRSLTSSMVHTPKLRSITLWFPGTDHGGHCDRVDGEVFLDFCKAILRCSHLSKLLLWHVPLGTEEAIKLLEACKQHRELSIIRLSRCYTMPCQELDQLYSDLQGVGRRIYMAHGY